MIPGTLIRPMGTPFNPVGNNIVRTGEQMLVVNEALTIPAGYNLDIQAGAEVLSVPFIPAGTSGSWSPVWGGFSSQPTIGGGSSTWYRIGNLVIASIQGWNGGISNSTSKTVTLPFAAKTSIISCLGAKFDNGAWSVTPCRLDTIANSVTANLYSDPGALGTWTASGSAVAYFTAVYEAL